MRDEDHWIDELERDLGPEARRELLDAVGGQKREVPSLRHAAASQLAREIGEEVVEWLSRRLGRGPVEFPSRGAAERERQANLLRAAILDAGLVTPTRSVNTLATEFGVTASRVQRVRKELRAEMGVATEPRQERDPQRVLRIEADPELERFIRARVATHTLEAIVSDVAAAFPRERRVNRSTLSRWRQQHFGARPGKAGKIEATPELESFVRAQVDRLDFAAVAAAVARTFPPEHHVSRSQVRHWWLRNLSMGTAA